jgi:hypothetical protein
MVHTIDKNGRPSRSVADFRIRMAEIQQSKFQFNSLRYQLDSLGREVNRRFNKINNGGCCVYAALVAACLAKRGIVATGIVAGPQEKDRPTNIDEVRKALPVTNRKDLWNDGGVIFSHVGLELAGKNGVWHYDSNGMQKAGPTLDCMPIYEGRLRLNEMQELADEIAGWNDMFDRKFIPAIAATVKHYVSLI